MFSRNVHKETLSLNICVCIRGLSFVFAFALIQRRLQGAGDAALSACVGDREVHVSLQEIQETGSDVISQRRLRSSQKDTHVAVRTLAQRSGGFYRGSAGPWELGQGGLWGMEALGQGGAAPRGPQQAD